MKVLTSYAGIAVVAISLLACNSNAKKKSIVYSTERLDTIRTASFKNYAAPMLFEAAFLNGTQVTANKLTANLFGFSMGKLIVSSGKIIACDPALMEEYGIPFTQTFPIGQFPVELAVAKVGAEETIAFARVNFSSEAVVKWEVALLPNQKAVPVYGTASHGFVVDAGLATFLDNDAKPALDQDKVTSLDGAVYQTMAPHNHYGWRYTLYPFGKFNMAVYSAGFGDGRYTPYIGFDAAGKPCRLLVDFGIFSWQNK